MIYAIWVGSALAIMLTGLLLADQHRERTRKVRRKAYASAVTSVDTIDAIVDRYYRTADLVSQTMCDEIRAVIHQHRKDTTAL